MSDFERCPCCRLPTLDARGEDEICPVCWWEDDGRDATAAITRARTNYADHFDRYDAGKGIPVVARPSAGRVALVAWLRTVRAGTARYDEGTLHGLLRGLDHG